MMTIPAPPIARTIGSDPCRDVSGTADVDVAGACGAAATTTMLARTRTEPAGSVPVAMMLCSPVNEAGIVTSAVNAPALSVITVANRTGSDSIVI